MILNRLIKNAAEQDWFVVFLEIVIVFVGIFLGIQATNWNEDRKSIADGYYYLDHLQKQLDAEAQMIEDDIARLSDDIDQVNSALNLLYADSWSDDEYAQFKSDHVAAYNGVRDPRQPSALRQLLDAGKIDLVESWAVQEMLFGLDRAYEEAIGQTKAYVKFADEAVIVLSMAIPYGAKDDLMAIPADPSVLLQSEELKWALRMIVIMNKIQLDRLNRLLTECTQVRDELKAHMSSNASRIPRTAD